MRPRAGAGPIGAWLALLLAAVTAPLAGAQSPGLQTPPARALITAVPDSRVRVRLAGDIRREATPRNDRGPVAGSLPLDHIQLLLRRPAEREAALRGYLEQLHDPRSPRFHRWLTVSELAQSFGPAQRDIAAVTGWLAQQGLHVNAVYPGALIVDFSGTVAQVQSAFHTQMHAFEVGARRHIANVSDPWIPAALAPAVVGIVSLHDFRPHPQMRPRAQYTVSSSLHLLAPADLATIYNLSPLFGAGTSGQGQSVVVLEDTNVSSTADWATFRSTFGLSAYTGGSFSEVHPAPPSGTNNCRNPGVVADNEGEAALDAEWASAAAPSAAIVLASCADTTTTFGGLIALENLLAGSAPPAIVSISYGECEADNGLTANAAYASVYEEAVALGTSVFVAAGDEGAASCDAGASTATHGIAVNGFASTPDDVAVGGTDFGDLYLGATSSYWSATNGTTYGSALSYVPEIPWDDSCASPLIAGYLGDPVTYGTGGFCNSSTGESFLTLASGGGGPSSCALPATGGGCQGYPKPTWQAGVAGNPADGVRDLPDVSLFAGNGIWGHYYVYCDSRAAACTGAPSGWSGAGGTSFGAPILAGVQALVDQSTGARQGNPDPVYYALAAGQAASTLTCGATSGSLSSGCVFPDTTLGGNDVNCLGSSSCYLPGGTNGVLSVSDTAYQSAYPAGAGWDFATGIGSINAVNLVQYWGSADLTLMGGGTVTGGGLLSYTWQVGNTGPQAAAGVQVSTVLPAGFTLVASSSSPGCSQSGQALACTVGALAVGASAGLILVIQPVGSAPVNLTFTATSSNTDIDPNQAIATVSLAPSQLPPATDGPLPLWAYAVLAALLIGVAHRSLRRVS